MQKNSTQQEILLMTGTSFSARQWADKIDSGEGRTNQEEQLEEACWNGLLPEMLPEIFADNPNAKKLYLWKIRQAKSFLEIELGETPVEIDKYFSLDPDYFLSVHSNN
jgi:hypothetical protein